MTYKIDKDKYVFFNYKGEAIVWTSNFDDAMMLIREFNMEKRDAQNRDD